MDREARYRRHPQSRANPARVIQTVVAFPWEAEADFARGIITFGVRRLDAAFLAVVVHSGDDTSALEPAHSKLFLLYRCLTELRISDTEQFRERLGGLRRQVLISAQVRF